MWADDLIGLETRYSAVASPIRSAQTMRLPATTANATGLPAPAHPCTHTKRASDFCSPFQGLFSPKQTLLLLILSSPSR
ncbi:hypothetical protein TNCV_1032151 [Trichonephila clavipes]|nr:hypothetical protein TNCV_1032151 [Trichonephila clavipes]